MGRKVQYVQLDHMVVVEKAALCDLMETQGAVEYPQLRELLMDDQKMVNHLLESKRQLLKAVMQGWDLMVEQNTALPGSPCLTVVDLLTRSK